MMSHTQCKSIERSYTGQADSVMSHCCAKVIDNTLSNSVSGIDAVGSIDSVSSSQVICGAHRPAVSEGGIHKATFDMKNQQCENHDSIHVKCADQHIAVRVEWGNMVHTCVLCHSIKAEIEKRVCFLNNGCLEMTDDNLKPNAGCCIPNEVSHSTLPAHTGGVGQGGVDTAHPRGIDQGEADTPHPRGIDQVGVDTAHPSGIDQGDADSGCAFFEDTKPDIKTLICSEERGKVRSAGLKEIGSLQLNETQAVVGICLNIKQEFGGESSNIDGQGDRGYWHNDVKAPLEVPLEVESLGRVTHPPSPSLLSVEPKGLPLETPSTENPLTTDKHPSHKPRKALRVMLCNRGAQCYHNQPQDHLNKGIQTAKGCDDLRVQEQQLTGVQNILNDCQIGCNGPTEGGKGTQGGVWKYQLNRNSFNQNSNAEVMGFEVPAQKARSDKANVPLEKPHQWNICGKDFSQKCKLNQQDRSPTLDKPFKYDDCGKGFTRKVQLKRHLESHSGDKSSEFVVFGKMAPKNCFKNLHPKQHTRDEKHFECSLCKKRFTRKDSLLDHERAHTGEHRFHCEVCNKKFPRRSQFLRHQRTHTGEKPFACMVCHKKFSDQFTLKIHGRIHTGEKPFECNVCGKKFPRRDYLLKHQRMHTAEKPFECIVCQKKFSDQTARTRHQRVHTGEKPHKCPTCGKRFSRRDHLRKHQRMHTAEKPFECTVCYKKFSRQEHVKRHQRTHTAEKPFECMVFSQNSNIKTHTD